MKINTNLRRFAGEAHTGGQIAPAADSKPTRYCFAPSAGDCFSAEAGFAAAAGGGCFCCAGGGLTSAAGAAGAAWPRLTEIPNKRHCPFTGA